MAPLFGRRERETEAHRFDPFGDESSQPEDVSAQMRTEFTEDEVALAAVRLKVDFTESPFNLAQFGKGMNIELEHGLVNLRTNISDDDAAVTAKIALAHLRQLPDYYDRLEEMLRRAGAPRRREPRG